MRSLALLGCALAAAAGPGPTPSPPPRLRIPRPSPPGADIDAAARPGLPETGARFLRSGPGGGHRRRLPAFGGPVRPAAPRPGPRDVRASASRRAGWTSPSPPPRPPPGPLRYSDGRPPHLPRLEVARTAGHKLSVDRLRVDLMRSELAAKEAEGRAARYERELDEVRRRYLLAQNALRDLRDRSRTATTGSPAAPPAGGRGGTAQEQVEAIQRRKAMVRDAEVARAEGSDGLPPMAAALFARAEREERERQWREGRGAGRAGVEDGDDGDGRYLEGLERAVVDLRRENEGAAAAAGGGTGDGDASAGGGEAGGAESFQRALLDRRLNGARDPAPPAVGTPILSSEIMDGVVYDATPSAGRDDRAEELRAENEGLVRARQALRSKLAHSESLRRAQAVELERSVSSERMLRGLQSDWTRRLAEARQESDDRQKELEERHEAEREGWSAEAAELGRALNRTAAERDELGARLEVQSSDIRHAARVLCRLVLHRLRSLVADLAPESKRTSGRLSDRMTSVGGGDPAPREDGGGGRSAIGRLARRTAAAPRGLGRGLARLLGPSRGGPADERPGDGATLLKLQSRSRLAAPKEIFRSRRKGGEDDERGELPGFLQQDG